MSITDNDIEAEIQKKGLTAPRITPQALEDSISDEAAIQYYVFPGTTVTVCCVPMRNGYQVVGKSAAASPENFDGEVGRKVALQDAKRQMWALLGYALREDLTRAENIVTK